MKVWITKYALTTGIEEVEANPSEEPSMIIVPTRHYNSYYHKPFWHLSREKAVEHANKLRIRKLESLHKAILKLESRVF